MARTIAWYGSSGSFKSTQGKFFAKYIYQKTGKKTRVVLTDSSAGDMFKPLEAAGICEVWRISALDNPLPVARLLAKGYWPSPTLVNGKVQMVAPTPKTWEEVGGILWDSMTTFCDLIMQNLVENQRNVGEDVVKPFSEKVNVGGTETEVKFAASARAHYNFIQNQVYSLINAMSSLPIEAAGITFLESKGEEQDRTSIYGPALVGKAATPKVPAWVGDCIHLDDQQHERVVKVDRNVDGKMVKVDEKVFETVTRAYFMRHPDAKTGINFPAKPRVPSELWPKVLEKYPGGFFIPEIDKGLDAFLEFEDQLLGEQGEALKKWREQIDAQRKGGGPAVATAPAKLT